MIDNPTPKEDNNNEYIVRYTAVCTFTKRVQAPSISDIDEEELKDLYDSVNVWVDDVNVERVDEV